MGTYTTNYQLYMPTVGETGWGTLVNTNFSTIDSTMKSLNTRLTAVENEVNGALSCTSVTTSGKITGNGGIVGTTGTFSGAVTASNIKTVVRVSSNGTHQTGVATGFVFPSDDAVVMVLPPLLGVKYTGTVKYYSHGYKANIKYITSLGSAMTESYGVDNGIQSITLNNAQCLLLTVTYNNSNFELCDITLS